MIIPLSPRCQYEDKNGSAARNLQVAPRSFDPRRSSGPIFLGNKHQREFSFSFDFHVACIFHTQFRDSNGLGPKSYLSSSSDTNVQVEHLPGAWRGAKIFYIRLCICFLNPAPNDCPSRYPLSSYKTLQRQSGNAQTMVIFILLLTTFLVIALSTRLLRRRRSAVKQLRGPPSNSWLLGDAHSSSHMLTPLIFWHKAMNT